MKVNNSYPNRHNYGKLQLKIVMLTKFSNKYGTHSISILSLLLVVLIAIM